MDGTTEAELQFTGIVTAIVMTAAWLFNIAAIQSGSPTVFGLLAAFAGISFLFVQLAKEHGLHGTRFFAAYSGVIVLAQLLAFAAIKAPVLSLATLAALCALVPPAGMLVRERMVGAQKAAPHKAVQ